MLLWVFSYLSLVCISDGGIQRNMNTGSWVVCMLSFWNNYIACSLLLADVCNVSFHRHFTKETEAGVGRGVMASFYMAVSHVLLASAVTSRPQSPLGQAAGQAELWEPFCFKDLCLQGRISLAKLFFFVWIPLLLTAEVPGNLSSLSFCNIVLSILCFYFSDLSSLHLWIST